MLHRIIVILLLTALASFGVDATEVSVDWGKTVNDKVNCIIAHGGMHSKKAAVCFQTNAPANQPTQVAMEQVVATTDTRPRDGKGLYHWKKVNGNPAKAAYRSFAKDAHPEIFIDKKIHSDLIAMGLTSNDMDKVFYPIFNQVQDNLGLLKGSQAEKHQKQWTEMFRNGTRYPDFIQKGDILKSLSFRKGIIQNVIADFEGSLPTFVFPLENGKELLWIPLCQNFAIRESIPPVVPGKPEVVEVIPPPEEVTVKEEKNVLDDWELYVSMGGSIGPHGSAVGYGAISGAYFPGALIKDMENGRLEGGVGMQANGWIGQTHDDFHYNGFAAVAGPAIKYIDWNGWDFEARIQAGILRENGHKGDYDSQRQGIVIGPSVSFNDYHRQLEGHDWFPEYGFYGSILLPLGFDAEHSWQGKGIADTTDLRKFGYLANISGRVFFYKNDDWGVRFYTQAGLFIEDPTSESISLRLGIGDTKKRWGVGVGPNFDLIHNWNPEFGADAWADVSVIVDVNRNESNMDEMRRAFDHNGVTYDGNGLVNISDESPRSLGKIPHSSSDGLVNLPE
jgi:hypothetical protein